MPRDARCLAPDHQGSQAASTAYPPYLPALPAHRELSRPSRARPALPAWPAPGSLTALTDPAPRPALPARPPSLPYPPACPACLACPPGPPSRPPSPQSVLPCRATSNVRKGGRDAPVFVCSRSSRSPRRLAGPSPAVSAARIRTGARLPSLTAGDWVHYTGGDIRGWKCSPLAQVDASQLQQARGRVALPEDRRVRSAARFKLEAPRSPSAACSARRQARVARSSCPRQQDRRVDVVAQPA